MTRGPLGKLALRDLRESLAKRGPTGRMGSPGLMVSLEPRGNLAPLASLESRASRGSQVRLACRALASLDLLDHLDLLASLVRLESPAPRGILDQRDHQGPRDPLGNRAAPEPSRAWKAARISCVQPTVQRV